MDKTSHTTHIHMGYEDGPDEALLSSMPSSSFCHGMPMTMYMEGFQWALLGRSPPLQINTTAHRNGYDLGDHHMVRNVNPMAGDDRDIHHEIRTDEFHGVHKHTLEFHPPGRDHSSNTNDAFHSSHLRRLQQHPLRRMTATGALPPCLVYLVPTWMLDSRGSFEGAVVFSFLLALLMEILSSIRSRVVSMRRRQQRRKRRNSRAQAIATNNNRNGNDRSHNNTHHPPIRQRRCWDVVSVACSKIPSADLFHHGLLTIIYALQAILGYILMFMAMTFSVEILSATIMGLMVGNLLFFRYPDFQSPSSGRKKRDLIQRTEPPSRQGTPQQQPQHLSSSSTLRLRHPQNHPEPSGAST